MTERILVINPDKRFPDGIYTGDMIKLPKDYGQRSARVCTAVEWGTDRPTAWPPHRPKWRGGTIPYIIENKSGGHRCFIADPYDVRVIKRNLVEKDGQLRIF